MPLPVTRAPGRGRGDGGSSLMLMPAAVLIVLLLGAIAVDLGEVRLAQRDLLDVASSAANDAATDALDLIAFRADGSLLLDLSLAERSLDRSLARHHLGATVTGRRIFTGPAPDEVTVELERPVPAFFAKSIPGAPRETTVRARASAFLHRR